MSALPKSKLTEKQYVAIENAAEFRSEFFDGEMFAMAGASENHNDVLMNLSGELHTRLKGGRCRVRVADQRCKVERTGLYTYPDIVIIGGKSVPSADDPLSIINPTAILEISSPSTKDYDRGAKFRNYQQIPSLVEYVLVAQDEAVIERFIRQGDGSWGLVSFVGLDAELALTSVPVRIPLSEIYSGVTFPDSAGSPIIPR